MSLAIPPFSSWAEQSQADRDKMANEEALRQTVELLRNKSQRESSLKDDKAKGADQSVKNLTGGNEKLTEEVYGLAADLFESLYKEANGDAQKMQELLQNYSANPEAFANRWTPEQRAKLKSLSERVPAKSPAPR